MKRNDLRKRERERERERKRESTFFILSSNIKNWQNTLLIIASANGQTEVVLFL